MKRRSSKSVKCVLPGQKGGFSLLEVLIAITILSVGVLAVAGMQSTSIKSNYASNRMANAIGLVQEKMEWLMGLGYTDIRLTDNNPSNNGNLTTAFGTSSSTGGANNYDGYLEQGIDRHGDAGGDFDRFYNVADSTPAPDMKTVAVMIRWQEKGKTRTVALETILGR